MKDIVRLTKILRLLPILLVVIIYGSVSLGRDFTIKDDYEDFWIVSILFTTFYVILFIWIIIRLPYELTDNTQNYLLAHNGTSKKDIPLCIRLWFYLTLSLMLTTLVWSYVVMVEMSGKERHWIYTEFTLLWSYFLFNIVSVSLVASVFFFSTVVAYMCRC